METLQTLRHRIGTAEELQSVVTTMKGLASVNIRQYERAVESLRDYQRTIELGFQILLRNRPETARLFDVAGEGPVAAIVVGSDQGMCGPLNREIADYTLAWLEETAVAADRRKVVAVGARAAVLLEAFDQPVDQCFALPDTAAGITTRVQDLLVRIDRWRTELEVSRIVVFHQEPARGSAYEPKRVQLLPLDREWFDSLLRRPWATNELPSFTSSWETLFPAVVREHLFVVLFQAFAESLASENASRLASMQAAEKNIEERLDNLQLSFHRLRQATVTEELLDVISGFEVMKKK